MKRLIFLCIFLPIVGFSQLPFSKGKESSIIIPKIGTGGGISKTINFEFSESRIGFSSIIQSVDKNNPPDDPNIYPDKSIRSLSVGFALNESTFSLYEKGVSPGIDVEYNLVFRHHVSEVKYRTWVIKPFFESKNVKNAVFNSDSSLITVRDNIFQSNFGLTFGRNWYSDDETIGSKRIISLSGVLLYSDNSTDNLKKKDLVDVTGRYNSSKGASVVVQSSESYYVGELVKKMTFIPRLDMAFYLTSFKDSQLSKDKLYSNPSLFLVSRASVEISNVGTTKCNFVVGPSITKYSRQVVGAILFGFYDVFNKQNSFNDIFSLRLYFGLPLAIKP